MRPMLTLVYSYYENWKMLQEQLKFWSEYPPNVLKHVEFIVTDDCSTNAPLNSAFVLPANLNIRIFRITKKVPWNWLACRNIGAHHAKGDWLLLTDMDHVLLPQYSNQTLLLTKKLSPDFVYMFSRRDMPHMKKVPHHKDSFFLSKDLFWRSGGYDEDLSGHYGTSGQFRRRVIKCATGWEILDIPLIRYSRSVIDDACTVNFVRKTADGAHHRAMKKIIRNKILSGTSNVIKTLSFPYEEVPYGPKSKIP